MQGIALFPLHHFLNHSCQPNAFVDGRYSLSHAIHVVAVEDIAAESQVLHAGLHLYRISIFALDHLEQGFGMDLQEGMLWERMGNPSGWAKWTLPFVQCRHLLPPVSFTLAIGIYLIPQRRDDRC